MAETCKEMTDQLNIEKFQSEVVKIMERGYCIIDWVFMVGGFVPVFKKPV